MEEKGPEERQLIKVEELSLEKMSLEQKQLVERVYYQFGLDPVVNKVLKEFSNSLSGMDRVIDRIFGPYDVKGRADAVAKITTFVMYTALGEQRSKEVGNLESQIMTLEGERDQVRNNYDKLVERVADVVGGDYDRLKTNYSELMERLAEVEKLRSQVATLRHEHNEEVGNLRSQITECNSRIKGLESEKATLTGELEQLRGNYDQLTTNHETVARTYDQLKTGITTVAGAIPYEEISKKLGEELYTFLLKDSKVPDRVIDGVGRFIDFKKYLGMAVERGAKEACKRTEEILGKTIGTVGRKRKAS